MTAFLFNRLLISFPFKCETSRVMQPVPENTSTYDESTPGICSMYTSPFQLFIRKGLVCLWAHPISITRQPHDFGWGSLGKKILQGVSAKFRKLRCLFYTFWKYCRQAGIVKMVSQIILVTCTTWFIRGLCITLCWKISFVEPFRPGNCGLWARPV